MLLGNEEVEHGVAVCGRLREGYRRVMDVQGGSRRG